MVDETDVLRELSILHHVDKKNAVKAREIADVLDVDPRVIGNYLARLEAKGKADRYNENSSQSSWRPWNWRRY